MTAKADTDAIIADYVTAYKAANGADRPVIVSYERGWFKVHTYGLGSRIRRREILEMTTRLKARATAEKEKTVLAGFASGRV